MLHPSYSDLMKAVNSDIEEGEQPVVQSRYSIVIATAKRARQIIAGSEPLVGNVKGKKPLSSRLMSCTAAMLRFLALMKLTRMIMLWTITTMFLRYHLKMIQMSTMMMNCQTMMTKPKKTTRTKNN